jgi:hypothetical protein
VPYEFAADAAALMTAACLRVDQECVIFSVPCDVDESEEDSILIARTDPTETVRADPAPPRDARVATMRNDQIDHLVVGHGSRQVYKITFVTLVVFANVGPHPTRFDPAHLSGFDDRSDDRNGTRSPMCGIACPAIARGNSEPVTHLRLLRNPPLARTRPCPPTSPYPWAPLQPSWPMPGNGLACDRVLRPHRVPWRAENH